jgi:hypothetical protein
MPSKGLSTVFAPIQVKMKIIEMKNQNLDFLNILNFEVFLFFTTKILIIKIESTKATTPPNLEGMDRKIT